MGLDLFLFYLGFWQNILDGMIESEVDHVEAPVSSHRGSDGLSKQSPSSVWTSASKETFFLQDLFGHLTCRR